ncbi:MAG TPA: CHASE4 domain-containing protein [Candidatus Acidoferrales bacterium]|jgi:PAS domain S-box-containing protein|nr:CHASE4 domain-containing protein [Candidatus Acidoferrales bacterium]
MRFRLRTSLRNKTLFIVLAALIGLVGGLFVLSRAVLLRGFSRLEADFATENLGRASSALSNEMDTLQHTTDQYADSDQTYAYLRGPNSEAVHSEFPARIFEQLRVNFIVVLDSSGRKVFSKGFNVAAMTSEPVPEDLDAHLQTGSPLLGNPGETSDVAGIVMLATGPVLIDSSAILTTNSDGPLAGRMIMGRSLDADENVRLAEMTHMPVDIEGIDSANLPPDFRVAANTITDEKPNLIGPDSRGSLAAYQELHDINGNPAAILRVLLPRKIYEQGQTSLLQFLLLLLAAGMVFGAVTMYLLERFVISRVGRLSDDITQIGASGDLGRRLRVSGHDELAHLGDTINSMLEDLEIGQIERHAERARLTVMVEKMPAVLWTTDAQLQITSAMGAGLDALGLRALEPVGLPILDFFFTKDDGAPPIAAHRRALEGQAVAYEVTWKERRFESHVQPLRDGEGVIQGVIGVALDITERERLTDQLRQSQKMQAVGELAGGVAHDFNNLLMVVKGHAQLLLERMPDSSPLRLSVEQVEKAADRAATLTRQLLAFSRKQVLQARVLDMNDTVAGMIRMFSRVIGENIDMAFLPGGKLGRVKADPGQIEQVLLNLVVNSRDAMPDGGRLTIETSNVELDTDYAATHTSVEPGLYVMLTVTDTGCGMDAATQARIFEPFFTTKGPGKGTGLGLATVYGVVKQSGGYIYVYSEINRGTTFKIYLPQVTADLDAPSQETEKRRSARGTETILFVEDEQSVRELVRDYLVGAGYCVLEASDGVQASKVAATHPGPIHMLITDVVMPHVSGPELATKLVAERTDLKVLFISGYTDDTVFRHGVLEGGVAFLQKPFNLKALAQKIREVLGGQPAAAPRADLTTKS